MPDGLLGYVGSLSVQLAVWGRRSVTGTGDPQDFPLPMHQRNVTVERGWANLVSCTVPASNCLRADFMHSSAVDHTLSAAESRKEGVTFSPDDNRYERKAARKQRLT